MDIINREQFISIASANLKLIRTEYNFSQEKMANLLGLSKKTFVEVEKGRKPLSWSVAVALSSLFNDSEILKMSLGDDIENLIRTIAFTNYQPKRKQTMGGKVWWATVDKREEYIIQQNIISRHYRLLDGKKRLLFSSYSLEFLKECLTELATTNEEIK